MKTKEIIIDFANGFQLIIWQNESKDGNRESYIGICNQNGYVITDRKLTVSEADRINSLTHNP